MALTKCKECGGPVSTKADSCPHCGAPVRQRTKCQADRRTAIFLKVVGIALLAGVVLLLLARVGKEMADTSTLPSTEMRTALSFKQEAARVTDALNCPDARVTPPSAGSGVLYGCIVGAAQSVSFFIEAKDTGQIENIELMWTDYTRDIGYGIHADKRQARAFVRALTRLYAPQLKDRLLTAFFSRKDESLETEQYDIAYTYDQGQAIDEHLLTLTPKPVLRAA